MAGPNLARQSAGLLNQIQFAAGLEHVVIDDRVVKAVLADHIVVVAVELQGRVVGPKNIGSHEQPLDRYSTAAHGYLRLVKCLSSDGYIAYLGRVDGSAIRGRRPPPILAQL